MYGVIDIGSNTVRLSVYEKTDVSIRSLLHKKSMVGLAGHVDKDGNMTPEGIARAVRVLAGYRDILRNIEVKDVFVFATASLRNINNTAQALKEIHEKTGFTVDLVSGEQEALYDFVATTHFMELDKGVLVDIGGGSTELVFYNGGIVEKALSMPIGSLSLHNRFVKDILPTEKELEKIRECVKDELKKVDFRTERTAICGIGGSIRGAHRLYRDTHKLPLTINSMQADDLGTLLDTLSADRKFAVQKILKAAPDRIHTLLPGMTILDQIARRYGSRVVMVSDYGVREGYLYSKLFLESSC